MFQRILVGYDGSTGSRAALAAGLRLAGESGATVTTLTVQHHLPRYGATIGEVDEEREAEAAQARRLVNEIQAEAADHDTPVTTKLAVGHPAQEILRTAKAIGADLIVLGHSGHSAAWGGLLGGVTDRVSHHTPCSVLIVR
jgi:nucleotide-binding universal stress UspA family protein